MKGVNKVILLGIVGDAPELRYTTRQHPIGTFPLATHRQIINVDGEREERTDWHNIVMFGKKAEYFSSCLKKGSRIYVDGVLEYHDVPHARYKDVILHKTHIEAKRIEVIDGLVLHPYPKDFPPLTYGKKGDVKKMEKNIKSEYKPQVDDLFDEQ